MVGRKKKKEVDKRCAAADFVVAKTPSITSFFIGTPAGSGGCDSSDNDSDMAASSYSYSDSGTDIPTLVNEVADPTLVPPGPTFQTYSLLL